MILVIYILSRNIKFLVTGEQIRKATPHHMDEEGYISIQNHIKSSDSHHFFLTARNVNFKSIT